MRYDREKLEERAANEVSLAKDAKRAGDERWVDRHLDLAAALLKPGEASMTRRRGIEGSALAIDEVRQPERRRIGPIKARISRKARRAARHCEVAALGSEWRTRTYHLQNQGWGAANTGADGLTPRQRRRVKHKANAGRG